LRYWGMYPYFSKA